MAGAPIKGGGGIKQTGCGNGRIIGGFAIGGIIEKTGKAVTDA